MSEIITRAGRRPALGRSVGLVAFLFGLTGRESLPGPVLRRLLEDLGLSPGASRGLLARMRRQGQLAGARRGREVDYRLAGEFAVGFARVRDRSVADPPPWRGHFDAVLYQVPETHRAFRDTLRRAAVLSGYGILQPGVLIAPTDRSARLADVLDHRPDQAQVWLTTLTMDTAAAARAASLAWDLPALARDYHRHVERLDRAVATHRAGLAAGSCATGSESIRDYVDALLPALTATVREPGLPVAVIPADWPGPSLRLAIDRCTRTFSPTTGRYLERLLDDPASAGVDDPAGTDRPAPQ